MALSPEEEDKTAPDWVFAIFWMTFFVTLGIGIWSSVVRRRDRRRRKEYERRIEELKGRGKLSEEDIEAEVLADARPAKLDAERRLIADLVSRSFLDSPEFRAVERFVADHPPRLPREGKRIFNHAQLLTDIARARQMFGGDPPLEPEHLAKWVVLRARWPEISRAVLRSPNLLCDLEQAVVTDQLETQLHSVALTPTDVDGLTQLLRCEPQLGVIIERLIYFKPAAPRSRMLDQSPTTTPPLGHATDEVPLQSAS